MTNFHLGHGLFLLGLAVMIAGAAMQNHVVSLGGAIATMGAVLCYDRRK